MTTDPKPPALTPDELGELAALHRREVESWNLSLDLAAGNGNDEYEIECIDMIRLHERAATAFDQAASDREALDRVRALLDWNRWDYEAGLLLDALGDALGGERPTPNPAKGADTLNT